jgi:putative acetyltransferase
MVIIRPESEEDYVDVYEVNRRAFEGEDEARLVERVRKSAEFIPELSMVAVQDGKIVGHILLNPIEIKTAKGNVPALSLASMAVLPEFQRQGIGSLSVQKGLKECRRLGHKIVVVVGHPEYYPCFGFIPAREKGLEVLFSVPEEAFMACELVSGAREGVKGRIVYSKVFEKKI